MNPILIFLILLAVLVPAELMLLFHQFSDFFGLDKNNSILDYPLEYIKAFSLSAAVFIVLTALVYWIFNFAQKIKSDFNT